MLNFLNNKGLINARSGEPQNVNENSFLYSLEYLYFHGGFDAPSADANELRANMLTYLLEDIRYYVGKKPVYRNVLANTGLPEDQWLSRDQMMAYAMFSKEMGMSCHYEIFYHIKNHYLTYDNVNAVVNFKRIVMPWDVIFIGLLCDSKWAKGFSFILTEKFKDTYRRGGDKETSGEILSWIQMGCLLRYNLIDANFISRMGDLLVDRFGPSPLIKVLKIYFPEEGHPCRITS